MRGKVGVTESPYDVALRVDSIRLRRVGAGPRYVDVGKFPIVQQKATRAKGKGATARAVVVPHDFALRVDPKRQCPRGTRKIDCRKLGLVRKSLPLSA